MAEHRFRADTRLAYSMALRALTEFARTSGARGFYGPVSLSRLESEGLLVSGPDADAAAGVLAVVPGLAEVPA